MSVSVLIMAGGTGGHVFPALACAKALRQQGVSVHWLGTATGLEAQIVPQAGFPLHVLSISGVRGKRLRAQLLAPFVVLGALRQALQLLRRLRPHAVLGMGGFVTGPSGVAAKLLGIPLLIHEQNAIPGLTNRILARLATQVLQAFPGAFPDKYQALTTGNPLRAEFLSTASPAYQPHQPLHVLVVGGSLGAAALNQVVPQALAQCGALAIRHQCGRGNAAAVQARYAQLGLPHAQATDFIEDMAQAYTWADVVICRAGAMTISELAQSGRPAVLVPFPHAVDDHQTANALFLVKAGAAVLLPQVRGSYPLPFTPDYFSSDSLASLINTWQAHPHILQEMAAAARRCAQPAATQTVVTACLRLAGAAS